MLDFRKHIHKVDHIVPTPINPFRLTPLGSLIDNAEGACNRYTSNPEEYFIDYYETFETTTRLSMEIGAFTPAPAAFYSNGSSVRYWDGSVFTVATPC